MSVHDIQWHLYGVEMKAVFFGDIQHAQVNERIFVTRETYVTDFAGLFRLLHGFYCAAWGEDAVRVFSADDFVELHEVHMIRLQTFERFVDLPGGQIPGLTVD